MLEQLGFFVVGAALLGSAFQVVTARNLVHTVLWLGLTLATTSVVFLMLHAPFMAGIQLILYTGGVLTLMLFGVMLTHRDEGRMAVPNPRQRLGAGALLGLGSLAVLVSTILRTPSLPNVAPAEVTTQSLGQAFLTEHIMAFEVLSLLLLAAVLGAIVIARKGDPTEAGDPHEPRIPARRPLAAERRTEG